MPRGHCIVFSVRGLIPSHWPDHLNFNQFNILGSGVESSVGKVLRFKQCESQQVTHFLIWYPSAFIDLPLPHTPF